MWRCGICTHPNEDTSGFCAVCRNSRSYTHDDRPHEYISTTRYASLSRATISSISDLILNFFEVGSGAHHDPAASKAAILLVIILRVITFVFISVFASVGLFCGTIIGAIAAKPSGCGLFHGACVGALAGAVSMTDFLQEYAAWAYPTLGRTVSQELLQAAASFADILSARSSQQHEGLIISNYAHRWQLNIDSMSYNEELHEMLEGVQRASAASIKRLPWYILSDHLEAPFDKLCQCTICLQEMVHGDIVKHLPNCGHIFHMACLDQWLALRGSCPMCRGII